MQKKPTTRLGLSVQLSVNRGMSPPRRHKPHRTKNSLRDVILGGQDGLVNMLGIALGVVAAGGSNHVLVVTGIAAAITESVSMGAVAYTSFGTDRDFYLAEKETEQIEISSVPDEELLCVGTYAPSSAWPHKIAYSPPTRPRCFLLRALSPLHPDGF